MSRAIAFIICLCCSLSFACSSEDSSSTIEAPQNSQVETEGVAEEPVEVYEEESPEVPDNSPSTSPEIEEQILEPLGSSERQLKLLTLQIWEEAYSYLLALLRSLIVLRRLSYSLPVMQHHMLPCLTYS